MYGDYATIVASKAQYSAHAVAIAQSEDTSVSVFLLTQLIAQSGLSTDAAIRWLVQYDQYFGFSRIEAHIQGLSIDTQWSWVKQSMMATTLSQHRHALVRIVADNWPTASTWDPEPWALVQACTTTVHALNDRSTGLSDILDVGLAQLGMLVHAMQVCTSN